MASGKIYPKGVKGFQRHEKAPDFVLGKLIIDPRELVDWLKTDEGKGALKDYNGKPQLNLQILKGKTGNFLNFEVDTWEKGQSTSSPKQEEPKQTSKYVDESDMPF